MNEGANIALYTSNKADTAHVAEGQTAASICMGFLKESKKILSARNWRAVFLSKGFFTNLLTLSRPAVYIHDPIHDIGKNDGSHHIDDGVLL